MPFLVLLTCLLGVSACDDSSDDNVVQAGMDVSSRLDTTGMVHIDVNRSDFDTHENVTYSIKVTDADSGEVVYEINDMPATDVNNNYVWFDPVPDDAPLEEVYQLKRSFNIDYVIRHINGDTDSARHTIHVDETIVHERAGIDVVGASAQQRAGIDLAETTASSTNFGTISCTAGSQQRVICVASEHSSAVSLSNQLGTGTVISAAKKIATAKRFNRILTSTPVWLQAGGGYGGRSTYADVKTAGGNGGFAQTVTTIEHLLNAIQADAANNEPYLFYWLANSGKNGREGSGGPSTIVTLRPIYSPLKYTDTLVLIAGGGGGANSAYIGGDGGDAIASVGLPDTYGVGGHGAPSGTSYGGGTTHFENSLLIAEGGTEYIPGHPGFGGDSGSPRGWINSGGPLAFGSAGQGGAKPDHGSQDNGGGGGGGGFGGGGSGTVLNAGGSGSGGGSFARASTIHDSDAPTRKEDSGAHFGSRGWFRFVFNTAPSSP